ncbi:arginine--tRNA ligase [bacterium]|nr:MAG: arginine--tRNA ligase [bacterium]
MLRETVADLFAAAVRSAQAAGDLPAFDPPAVEVQRPRSAEHGDFATNVAMQLARPARLAPLRIAEAVARHVAAADFVGAVTVAPPGFINLTLADAWLAGQVDAVRAAGAGFADVDLGGGRSLQVEFVSANPTGPLHVGGARNAAIGDTLARVLEACGWRVQREYYLNDAGSQMAKFGASVYARYCQALGRDVPLPEDGYPGAYIADYAARIHTAAGDRFLDVEPDVAARELGRQAVAAVVDDLEAVLGRIRCRFDTWFSEQSLYDSGAFERVMRDLRAQGVTFERDGAEWLATSRFGGDRDEVLVRSSGQPGYYASDVAYHHDKFVVRGFDRVVDVWAVDHQNQARRMPFLMRALGLDPERLSIVLYDLVKVVEGGAEVKMSKRRGTFIALEDVLEAIDADAVRFMMLTRSNEQVIELDLDLARQQSNDNPVYYVQYGHARICSILRVAAERGLGDFDGGDVARLRHPAELALVRQMLRLSDVLEKVAADLAPHHLPHYAQELARAFHLFYHDCQVVDPAEPDLSRARLKLVDAARIALARVLDLMGMHAPEQM